MNAKTTNRKPRPEGVAEIRAEYDFSRGVRGKHYKSYIESSNVVVLEPDVSARFPNAAAVNEALRSLMRTEQDLRELSKRPVRGKRRPAASSSR